MDKKIVTKVLESEKEQLEVEQLRLEFLQRKALIDKKFEMPLAQMQVNVKARDEFIKYVEEKLCK